MEKTAIGYARWSFARAAARSLPACLLFTAAQAADPGAQPSAAHEPVAVEVFHEARVRVQPDVPYPESELERGREGWVVLNMMIDPKGKPYEVAVTDSSGNPVLEKTALKALSQMSFAPATSGNSPVDSSFILKMNFYTDGRATGASRKFVDQFEKVLKTINAGDKDAAAAEIGKLQPQNLYEHAFRSYGKYLYDAKWGTEAEQLIDLGRTVAGEKDNRYLPKEMFTGALIARFSLQVKVSEYGSALETWKTLEPLAPKATRDQLQRIVDQINTLRNSSQPVTTPGQITGTAWYTQLLKNHFSIAVTNGAVSEIKLRCKKQYLFFKYEPDVQYTVNPSAGDCGIEIIGDPGTSFNLVQS